MIISIHQPQYLPWLGYFDKISKSDVFVLLDNVQFKKNEWQNRNRIKTARGWQWLTVPVIHKFSQKIYEVKINNTVLWEKKHLNTLITNYSKAAFFRQHIAFFEQAFAREWRCLVDLNIHFIRYLADGLGLSEKRLVRASEYDLREDATERLIDICKQLQGGVYLSGRDGAKYLNTALFEKEGIQVVFQDYHHPRYPQLYGAFEPGLSAVDLLFNCGSESRSVLAKGG